MFYITYCKFSTQRASEIFTVRLLLVVDKEFYNPSYRYVKRVARVGCD